MSRNMEAMELNISKLNEAFSYLILNSGFNPDLGLFHGKMGHVLFFAYYARCSNNEQYEDFAYELLDDIYKEIDNNFPIDFENGLCGIGWGIEFLVQNGFIEGDTDEILEGIDRRVMDYDLYHFSDLSLRRGLAGITCYVIARLSACREGKRKSFSDDFLYDLKRALVNARFSEEDELPSLLLSTYLGILNGNVPEKIWLPEILTSRNIGLSDDLSSLSLGLDNGITGVLFHYLQRGIFLSYELELFSDVESILNNEKYLVVFNEESQASNYGIGTYIKSLVKALQDSDRTIIVIHLYAYRGKSVFVEQIDGVVHLFVSNIKIQCDRIDSQKYGRLYYRSIIWLLFPFLIKLKNTAYLLNYMKAASLALILKRLFPLDVIIVTVHYIEWRFRLMGDKTKLYEILSQPDKNVSICESIESEKELLDVCDQVIAVAEHSYRDLIDVYNVPKDKLIYIPHGIEDVYSNLTKDSFLSLRNKYGYTENEKILVIAGRLSSAKGTSLLAEAFVGLVIEFPQLRLIVVGDGEYTDILSKINPHWSKVSFTGYVNKKVLYELYSISDMGVLPSFYEEFGYVALEMMMMGLPLIVSRTTGLSELVLDGITGVTISLCKDNDRTDENITILKSEIRKMLNNQELSKQYANEGRIRYLNKYGFDNFKQSMSDLL